MERTVRIWVGNNYIDYVIDEVPAECTEDELYELALSEVFGAISIEILR